MNGERHRRAVFNLPIKRVIYFRYKYWISLFVFYWLQTLTLTRRHTHETSACILRRPLFCLGHTALRRSGFKPMAPTGGFVKCLAVSGSNLFAGTELGGVFFSTNNGASWTAVNNGLRSNHIISLAVTKSNLFAGTWSNGAFFCTNNGASWTTASDGLTSTIVRSFAVKDSNLFAGTRRGCFFSTITTQAGKPQIPVWGTQRSLVLW